MQAGGGVLRSNDEEQLKLMEEFFGFVVLCIFLRCLIKLLFNSHQKIKEFRILDDGYD